MRGSVCETEVEPHWLIVLVIYEFRLILKRHFEPPTDELVKHGSYGIEAPVAQYFIRCALSIDSFWDPSCTPVLVNLGLSLLLVSAHGFICMLTHVPDPQSGGRLANTLQSSPLSPGRISNRSGIA